jgi:hypothetical protein
MIRNTILLLLGKSVAAGPSFSVDPTSFAGVSYEGDICHVAVDVANSAQEWDYSDDASWLSVSHASKIGDDSDVWILVDAQPSGQQPPRTGHVTFTSAGCENVVVTINQTARPG